MAAIIGGGEAAAIPAQSSPLWLIPNNLFKLTIECRRIPGIFRMAGTRTPEVVAVVSRDADILIILLQRANASGRPRNITGRIPDKLLFTSW
jgi:hypothetical protein